MSKKKVADKDAQHRAIFDGPVKAQRGDIFKVVSRGTCVEYTDKIRDAEAAYAASGVPREMYRIAVGSHAVTKLREQIL